MMKSDSDSIFRRTLLGYYAEGEREKDNEISRRSVDEKKRKNERNRVDVVLLA